MARKRSSKSKNAPKPVRASSSGRRAAADVVSIEPYLDRLEARHREIVEAVRKLVGKIAPEVVESLDWGLPVYKTAKGRVCYLKSFPTHVQLGLWQGASLPDPDSLLQGSGDTMRHVRLKRVDDVQSKSLRALLRAAFRYGDDDR